MAISTINLKSFGLADPNADKMLMWDDSESAFAITGTGFDVASITGATALAVPPDGDDEINISDGGTLKRLDVKLMQNSPLFFAYHDTTLTLANSTTTKLAFNTEVIDTDGICDHSSTIGRITIPSGMDGIWLFGTKVACPGIDANELIRTELHINGDNTTNYYGTAYNFIPSGTNQTQTQNTVIVVECDASDYVEWYVMQNSGDSQDMASKKGNNCIFGWRIAGGEQ